jgi:hypothetical protein
VGFIKHKAKVRRGERGQKSPHMEAQRVDGAWNHDRQRQEIREMVHDRDTDFYTQVWRHPDTGKRTWHKRGRYSDPNMHGPASHTPSSPDS